MFGICIWAEVLETNILYKINKILAQKCKSQIHNPHITLSYNCKNDNLKEKISLYKKLDYFKKGKVYLTKTKNFYSLQQNYITNEDTKEYHISLAYKVDKTFTKEEIDFANTLSIPNIINKNEYNICLWNCNSVYTQNWFKIY